jgi:hypothetical protein
MALVGDVPAFSRQSSMTGVQLRTLKESSKWRVFRDHFRATRNSRLSAQRNAPLEPLKALQYLCESPISPRRLIDLTRLIRQTSSEWLIEFVDVGGIEALNKCGSALAHETT